MNAEGLRRDVIVFGASAGGVHALIQLFGLLGDVRACRLGVVLHRSPVFEGRLPEVLGRRSALPVLEPEDGAVWQPGRIYVAPRDQHMLADIDGVLRLSRGPRQHHSRPAVDPLFVSVARACGPRAVGVILTGMGDDGASGLIAISQAGGISLVQSPDEAPHPSMPRNALKRDHVAASVVLAEMPGILAALAEGRPVAVGTPAPA